jgi:hypothetical protein
MEQSAIYMYFVGNLLNKLPICTEIIPTILSYIDLSTKKICKLLAYKLIKLNNVKNVSGLFNTVNKIDNRCPIVLKSFDLIWDLIKMYLINKKEKHVIEQLYYTLSKPINFNVWLQQFLNVQRCKI